MTIQLLSHTPVFHGMVLDVLDPDIPEENITRDLRSYLTHSLKETWLGDPHEREEMRAIEPGPGPITQSLTAVRVVDSTEVIDVPEGQLPTQTIRTVTVDLDQRRG